MWRQGPPNLIVGELDKISSALGISRSAAPLFAMCGFGSLLNFRVAFAEQQ